MKKYFLNSAKMKIHRTDTWDKRCKVQTHNEHIQYFNDLNEAKSACDKRVKLCQICMKQETAEIGKKFL